MWAKKVPPNMIQLVKKCGMGVRITGITSGEEEYRRLCEELRGRELPDRLSTASWRPTGPEEAGPAR
jgi:hypothetical protein